MVKADLREVQKSFVLHLFEYTFVSLPLYTFCVWLHSVMLEEVYNLGDFIVLLRTFLK